MMARWLGGGCRNDVVTIFTAMPSSSTYDAMVGSGDARIIQDRDIVRELALYRNRTLGVEIQNTKLLANREHTLAIGAAYGLAPMLSMLPEDYFRLVANEPQLAAAIRNPGDPRHVLAGASNSPGTQLLSGPY